MPVLTSVDAALLGVVEGLTEFLPVSSTGHLILFEKLTGIASNPAFDVVIQAGAILAVVFHFRERLFSIFRRSDGRPGLSLSGLPAALVVATLPALAAGAAFAGPIKRLLFNPPFVAVMLFLYAFVILFAEKKRPKCTVDSVDGVGYKLAFLLGLFQCLALLPGTSRAAATITGAMFLGLTRPVAVEFSFLMSVPVIAAATVHELPALLSSGIAPVPVAIGLVVSFVTALLVIKWFIGFVGARSLAPFAWYRIALGAGVLSAYLAGGVS